MELSEKLRDNFDEMVVYKDLKKTNFFSALSLPSFMRDWLLKKFEDEDGNFDKNELAAFVKKYIPRKDDWNTTISVKTAAGFLPYEYLSVNIFSIIAICQLMPLKFRYTSSI